MLFIVFNFFCFIGQSQWIVIYDVGYIKDTVVFKNQKLLKVSDKKPYTGMYKEHYIGDVKVVGNYENGLKQGTFSYYHMFDYYDQYSRRRRNLDSFVNFNKGKREGEKIIFHEMPMNPYIKSIEHFKNDLLDGVCDYWDYSGQLTQIKVYTKGDLISEKNYAFDTSFYRIEFGIVGNPSDTISRKTYKTNDSLFLEIYGLSDSPVNKLTESKIITPLTKRGFKVKSFDVGYGGKGWPDDRVDSHIGNAFIIPKAFVGMDGKIIMYIDKVLFVDPNVKNYTLTGKRYIY